MKMNMIRPIYPTILAAFLLLVMPVFPTNAEILNDDEFGTLEIIDLSVIETAADIFGPVGLRFNVTRGGPISPGREIIIFYHGFHDQYVSLLDYSPDRIVKPLLMNEHTILTEGGLDREYHGIIGDTLGREYILMIIHNLPLTDERLESIALAPNEIEPDEQILSIAVNDFQVVKPTWTPRDTESRDEIFRDVDFIELDEFATFIDYPMNIYPYNPWPYMYLYPYARLRPREYINRIGPFSRNWYVVPIGNTLSSNFWDYASSGWIDDGVWIIPPGGYWQGNLRIDDPYTDYFLRILPYLVQENTSYMRLQVEINGTLVESSIDYTGAIGWGKYWTSDPFAYYDLYRLLRLGDNNVRLYWPEDEYKNLELQMVDMVPAEVIVDEMSDLAD